ncbi:hypothetical protein PHLGIDRAFT_363333 [Phlebiopsis gigantea 11061_1 CR5-6]|uniref:Uncharacterized protein n=1 Tax=Phlebiopsis gigantea (strain 11061_1 CR5-6) TaxID=745531 RepID=A0A0C3PP99_PHLG1|nr:hypothetical protein PHLGIDRAFT_363333 [Phlebiopsis gigantea 11061_1 CR5-6]
MATSRTPVPPVNLRDRIAALQQRNVSPTTHATTEPSPLVAPGRLAGGGSLRDKIANFERAGAVPAPKGRFGSSAPVTIDGSTKKRGELYGNRVPGLAKPSLDAVLSVRKRTVSSSDAPAHLRSTSPDIPPIPPLVPSLTGGSTMLASLDARALLADGSVARRIVSDVLPRKNSAFIPDPPVRNSVEQEVALVEESEVTTDSAAELPAKTQSEDTATVLDVVETSPIAEEDDVPAIVRITDEHKSEVGAITVEDTAIPPARSSEEVVGQTASPVPLAASILAIDVEAEPSVNQPTNDNAAVVEDLTTTTESDNASVLGDSTTGSESALNTPSDSASFPRVDSPTAVKEEPKEDSEMFRNPSAVISPEEVASSPLSSLPSGLRNSLNVRQSVMSEMSIGDESLALDAKDAIIITERPQIVSPTVTRAVIVPAPTAVPARSRVPTPPPVTPVAATEQAALESRTTRKSFHAVVHRKVRETSSSETVPQAISVRKPTPSLPASQNSTAQRIRAEGSPEPQSPGFGDLVSLMADAALLEEQLSSSRSPSKRPPPTPTLTVQAPIPDLHETESTKSTESPNASHLQPVALFSSQYQQSSSSSDSCHSYRMPSGSSPLVTHTRARTTSDHPSTPPRDPGRTSLSLRVRKQSMPGAYPRSSVCSEVSTEESARISKPPSPPLYVHDSSDASSIRSSTKSWKSPKKGLGRAGSWLFRGKSKNHASMEAGCAPGCF